MRQRVKLIIVLRKLGELFSDDVLANVNKVVLQLVANVRQEVVQGHLNFVFWLSRHNLIKDECAHALRQATPISAYQVDTFDLLDLSLSRLVPVLNFECRVLLFLEEQQTLEHAVDFDLEASVLAVDFSLQLLTHFNGVAKYIGSSGDHD
jgi:hypothetical protein